MIVPIPAATAAAGGSLLPLDLSAGRLRDSLGGPSSRAFAEGIATGADQRFLQLIQPVPATIAANAEALQNGYRDYQELSLSRSGLKTIYGLTLTLTLLLAVFAAIAGSVLLASSMTAPLLQLAEGTRAVAEGNYAPVREFPGSDELNLLTQSFNAMTRQLTDARDAVEIKQREVENAKAYLERVLANLSAGVIVLDHGFRLVTANFGASRILGRALDQEIGRPLGELDEALAVGVCRRLRAAGAGRIAARLLAAADRGEACERQHAGAAAVACARFAPAARGRRGPCHRVRRHHAGDLGAARGGLGRGGAPPGA